MLCEYHYYYRLSLSSLYKNRGMAYVFFSPSNIPKCLSYSTRSSCVTIYTSVNWTMTGLVRQFMHGHQWSHCLKQCWLIISWIRRSKIHWWRFDENIQTFSFQVMHFEIWLVKCLLLWWDLNMLTLLLYMLTLLMWIWIIETRDP